MGGRTSLGLWEGRGESHGHTRIRTKLLPTHSLDTAVRASPHATQPHTSLTQAVLFPA